MEKPKILIVDDEDEIRKTLRNYLDKRVECDLITAGNGYEALESIEKNSFDIIFLDIHMPGISGREVIMEVKKRNIKTMIFVITKWDSNEISQELNELGVDYIPKPLSLPVIKKKVEEKLKALNKLMPKKMD